MAAAQTDAELNAARDEMVSHAIIAAGVKNPRVIEAIRQVPRHEFLSPRQRRQAYFDGALPIGQMQTISSPFIVAFMTESLEPSRADKVLEVGTGSGYQAAVLSPLVHSVFTIEIIDKLGERAGRTLTRLGYRNVRVRIGDGYLGWPEHAPFDKIIVTCSPEKVPQPLVDQLREGGLLVIPVGQRYQQSLCRLRKVEGTLVSETLQPTLFVPMTGRAEEHRTVQPEPRRPQLVNGSFEKSRPEGSDVTGWYYQRQLEWVTATDAPDGQSYIRFTNRQPGRNAVLLQGFPLDGRAIGELRVSVWARTDAVQRGRTSREYPSLILTFYDAQRQELGNPSLGPLAGTTSWHRVEKTLRVPREAAEAVLRLGLFGATGQASFDAVEFSPRLR